MTKKLLAVLLVVCLAASVFSACGQPATPPSSAAEPQSTPAAPEGDDSTVEPASANDEAFDISVSHWMLVSNTESSQQYMDAVDAIYHEKYPNANVVWNELIGEAYHDLLKAQLASKSAPDVFAHQNSIVAFGRAGYLADLTGDEWDARILESTKPSVMYEDKLLAVPLDVSGWGIWYNKSVFDEYNLSIPTTYDEFLNICETLKAGGVTPINAGFQEGWPMAGAYLSYSSFIYGANENFGTDLYDGKVSFDGPEFMSMFEAIKELVDMDYLSKACMSTTVAQTNDQIAAGEIAMYFNGPWCINQQVEKGVDLGYFNIPDRNGNTYMTNTVGSCFSLNAEYPDRERGLDMLRALTDPSTLPILLGAAFSGMNDVETPQTTVGGQAYVDALARDKSARQINNWFPPSAQERMNQIVSKVAAGQECTEADLQAVQDAYEKDKELVNLIR